MIGRRIRSGSWLLGALVALGSCSGGKDATRMYPGPERTIPEGLKEEAAALADANNRFALELHQEVMGAEGNLFLSSFSISTAFAMTYAGARGATRAEMAGVLHFPETEALHEGFAALIRSLGEGARSGGYRLDIANRLWGQEGFPFLSQFAETTRQRYGAGLERVDFEDPERARGIINNWVAEQTEGRIRDLLPPGMIDALNTRLVLTNAVYFKGRWRYPFEEAKTDDADFHPHPGKTVSVPMMHRTRTFEHGREPGLQVLRLPYEAGGLSMVFVLPDSIDGLPDVEGSLEPDSLRSWIERTHPARVSVDIPRFRVRSGLRLESTLSRMGMPAAFQPDQADFSGMTSAEDLFISAAVHQAFVEVNEEGTEAAAATGVAVRSLSSDPVLETAQFRADHPFLFLIWDEITGSILFLGRIVDPSV